MLSLRDPARRATGVSDLALWLGVAGLYAPFVRSREASVAGSGGGEAICIALTDSGLRNRGRSLRGVYRASADWLACPFGFDDMEDSEGIAEIKL